MAMSPEERKAWRREYDAAYRAANAEKRKAQQASWYAANKEKSHAQAAAWKKANPEKAAAILRAWIGKNEGRYRYIQQNSASYVADCLGMPGMQNEIPKELLEAKRLQLKIKRLLKERTA